MIRTLNEIRSQAIVRPDFVRSQSAPAAGNAEVCALTDADLDDVTGGNPNLGGYTHCTFPREGLYVGPCKEPTPTFGDLGNSIAKAGVQGASGGMR